MDPLEIVGKEKILFDYMRENGYAVYHRSNLFLRDIQYGIRDYFRSNHNTDIGSRVSDSTAAAFVADLEKRDLIRKSSRNTWILNMEEYLNPPHVEEVKEKSKAPA